MRPNIKLLAAAMVTLGCATADIASAGAFTICAEHNALSRDLKLTLSNGCVSSSIPYLGQDLAADVDQNRALIKITGGFNYEELPAGQMITTDCGGGRQMNITVTGVDARRFHVMNGDEYAGVLDLAENSGRICAQKTSAEVGHLPYMMSMNWQPVDYSGWERDSAPTVMGVLEPVYAWHPESLEGRPEMDIKMTTWPGQDAMQVVVTMTGFLDDSVAGARYVALVRPGGEGWTIDGLWRHNLCARGTHAGQWTKNACL